MKRISLAFSVVIALLLLSCGGATPEGMSEKAKKNLETSRSVAKMFEAGDWSKTGDYVAADATDHGGMKGDVKGLDNIKASFDDMGKMMGDFKNETVREWADDDYTVQWMKESATCKVDDPMMGMKAGTRTSMNSIHVSKFNADSKITEHWYFLDVADVMKMMPKGPADMMGPKTDTTKMDKK